MILVEKYERVSGGWDVECGKPELGGIWRTHVARHTLSPPPWNLGPKEQMRAYLRS